ncbi:hypothetical protein LTR36_002180 [Oleoguttula mirabilis]|uniref:DUF7707 domain-containing protein n=1 Tax=Oleoguttula mirabilis TaxID=1507867 RepID=A0AAV9JL66_9PEZI|nr:hypothetical protein LTR36_002180 [Oleoguttula mirabilis]
MFYSTLLIAATALTGLVSAQNYSTSGALTIDPSGVLYDTRLAWCRAETNSCPQICGGQASPNTCDATTLNYTCTCTSGTTPNISSYDQTIPSFVCAQWIINCVDAHPNDLEGITACRSVVCGTKNASSGESSSSTSSASATATLSSTSSAASASATGSSTASSSSASASSSSGAVAMSVAMNYGTGILATGLLALFGLAL